jgi:hypothetical protein
MVANTNYHPSPDRSLLDQADLLRDAGRLLQLTLWAEEKMCLGSWILLGDGWGWLGCMGVSWIDDHRLS